MTNAAIEKRRANLEARGLDPGANLGGEVKVGTTVHQPTEFGTFIVYPNAADEAWFLPDAEHLARFRSRPG
jgi:hypothetical protein